MIRSVVTIYRYDRITDAVDPEQTYNRPYELNLCMTVVSVSADCIDRPLANFDDVWFETVACGL